MNIAVIGLGKMGISHLSILNALPDVKVSAIAETNRFVTRVLEKYTGIKAYSDYRKMLDREALDAVVICLPNSLHYQACIDSIEHKVSFFVEKPFTLDPNQSKEIIDKSRTNNLLGMVGYVNRYIKIFQIIKEMLESDLIGEVYDYKASMLGAVVHAESKETWRNSVSEGGGCLFDYGSHCIDLAIYLFGEIDEILSSELKVLFSKQCEDIVKAMVSHKSGVTGSIFVNWCDESQRKAYNEIEIFGKKGKIIANKQDLKVFLLNRSEDFGLESGWNSKYVTNYVENVPFYLRGEEFTKELTDFISCISEGRKPLSNIEDAYLTDKTIKMIREKAFHGN